MTDTCETCRFWSNRTIQIEEIVLEGACRKNPPVLKFLQGQTVTTFFNFPPVIKTDWCGEHQQKEPEQ